MHQKSKTHQFESQKQKNNSREGAAQPLPKSFPQLSVLLAAFVYSITPLWSPAVGSLVKPRYMICGRSAVCKHCLYILTAETIKIWEFPHKRPVILDEYVSCLLYTSDAADE